MLRTFILAAQDHVTRQPWLLEKENGMTLFNRATNIAQKFSMNDNAKACDEMMKLMGSYDGLKSKCTLVTLNSFKTY